MNNNNISNSQLIFDNPLLDSILKQASADAMKKLEILQKSKLNQIKQSRIEEKENENLDYFMENRDLKNIHNQAELEIKDDYTQKYFRDQYGKMIPSNFKTPNAFSLPESLNYDEEPESKLTEKELFTVIMNRDNIIKHEDLYKKFNFNKWLIVYIKFKNEKIVKQNKRVDIKEIITFFNNYVFSQRIVANKDFNIICEVTNSSFLDFLTILSVKVLANYNLGYNGRRM
jgi:hypothetical protein